MQQNYFVMSGYMLMVGYADIASENEKKNICLSSNMDFAAAYNCNCNENYSDFD